MDTAVDVTITGLVQGVFFRAGCAEQATRLGVTGWVANAPDGTVRGHFEGDSAAVDALVAWCRTGPPRARVMEVDVAESAAEGARDFRTR